MAKSVSEETTVELEEVKKARQEIAELISSQIAEIKNKRVTNPEQRLNAIANLYTAIK